MLLKTFISLFFVTTGPYALKMTITLLKIPTSSVVQVALHLQQQRRAKPLGVFLLSLFENIILYGWLARVFTATTFNTHDATLHFWIHPKLSLCITI